LVFLSIFQYDERDFKNDFVDICSVRRYRWSRVSQQRYKKSKKVKKRLDLYSKSLVYSDMTKGENMKNKEILEYLELINDQLTDAYHLTDTDGTVDANYAVSSAQELVDELTNNIENNITISEKEEHDFNEAMNGEFIGLDGLPLNYPYNSGDGEGRLKGNN